MKFETGTEFKFHLYFDIDIVSQFLAYLRHAIIHYYSLPILNPDGVLSICKFYLPAFVFNHRR